MLLVVWLCLLSEHQQTYTLTHTCEPVETCASSSATPVSGFLSEADQDVHSRYMVCDEPMTGIASVFPAIRNSSGITARRSDDSARPSHLFTTFLFKGFGIAFLKSLSSLKSGGFRVAIPFTQNFPEYDRIVTLPRIVLQTGIYYPSEYKFSVVFSVPVHIALYGASRLLEGRLTSKEFSDRIIKRRATESVKRVGVSVSVGYRVYNRRHVVFSIGPWMFFLPGTNFLGRALAVPALVASLMSSVLVLLNFLLFSKRQTNFTRSSVQATPTYVPRRPYGADNSTSAESVQVPAQQPPAPRPAPPSNPLSRALRSIVAYMLTKSPGLGYNYGWTHTSENVDSIGSTMLFEMQPFYPLSREMLFVRSLLGGSSATATAA